MTKKELKDEIAYLAGLGYARWLYNKYNKSELQKEYETRLEQDKEQKAECTNKKITNPKSPGWSSCLLCKDCPVRVQEELTP